MTRRLFAAVEIDPRVRAVLAEESVKLKKFDAKPVSEDCFHITLAFLGDTEEERIADAADAAEAAVDGFRKFETRLAGASLMGRDARVIYTEAESGGSLKRLAGRLSRELSARGFETEKRSFRAHVTLGRLRKGASPELREYLRGVNLDLTFTADTVTLFESTLTPKGPIYNPLASFKLM